MYGSSQTGFIPNSCNTFALISMLHHWLEATDGTGYVRAALLDYRKASYPVDHNSLVTKLYSLRIKPTIFNRVVDFLGERTQCEKIHSNCFSEFTPVPTGIPQVTRIGLWLLLVMIVTSLIQLTIYQLCGNLLIIQRSWKLFQSLAQVIYK